MMSSTETATLTAVAPFLPAPATEDTGADSSAVSNSNSNNNSNSSSPAPLEGPHEVSASSGSIRFAEAAAEAASPATRDYTGRRVTIGSDMEDHHHQHHRSSFGPPHPLGGGGVEADGSGVSHSNGNNTVMYSSRPPSGFGGGAEMDYFGGVRSHRDSMESTTAVLDAAILDLTRRRLSMTMDPSPSSGSSIAGRGWGGHSHGHHANTAAYSASLAARQQQLQQQQRELEQRQKELEIQRQHLIAGMQEHARTTSMLAAQHHHHQQQYHQNQRMMHGHSHQQQWWVCQVCSSKAFASQEEAMRHEMTCCLEPHRYEDGMIMAIPSDHMHSPPHPPMMRRSFSGEGPYGSPCGQGQYHYHSNNAILDPYSSPDSSGSGLFAQMKEAMPLAMPSDRDWLTPLHCFVRRHCVEVFTASEADVSTPSKGKRKPITVGQVGIRCPFCSMRESGRQRERGSVYYPTSIASIYNATMNLLQRHLHNCTSVPADIMHRFEILKGDDARSGTSKRYWIESSISLGLVDTPTGIRFSDQPPPPPPTVSFQHRAERRNSNDSFSSNINDVSELKCKNSNNNDHANEIGCDSALNSPTLEDNAGESATATSMADSPPLVTADDEVLGTGFSYLLMSQMKPCIFSEADRLGKRKGLPAGFPGLACRHCFGGYGTGRFFPSSIKTLSDTSKTLNVLHNHMMRCRKCPQEVRDTLKQLRETHEDERSKMRFGSQKAFFGKIWHRLHKNGPPAPPVKRKASGQQPGHSASASGAPLPAHGVYHPPPYPGPPLPPHTFHHHGMMDPRGVKGMHFGPPITLTPESYEGLDNLGRPIEDTPRSKRPRPNSEI